MLLYCVVTVRIHLAWSWFHACRCKKRYALYRSRANFYKGVAGSLKRNCRVCFVGSQRNRRPGAFLPEVVLAVLNCSESAGRQADTSWTLLLPDVDRLISVVIRKALLGRDGRFLFGSIRDDYLVVCST
jgi:hypothetical protein